MANPPRLLALVCVAACFLTACADPDDLPVRTAPPSTTQPDSADGTTSSSEPAAATNPPGEIATLIAVIDGDSLAMEVDGDREEVRLAGINTPEADECHGGAARDAMIELVTDAELVLTNVPDEDDRDQFGRLLRDVWADGTWVAHHQVANGHALALQTGTAQEAELVAAEGEAFEESLGMWAFDACGPVPSDGELQVRIGDVRYDPPGRDFENKDEEFVSLVNEGDDAVDLTGWIIRDESSRHRYVFPEIILPAGDALRIRTGCGDDGGRDVYWCADDAVWSNGGDTVILQNGDGTVIDRFKYEGDF